MFWAVRIVVGRLVGNRGGRNSHVCHSLGEGDVVAVSVMVVDIGCLLVGSPQLKPGLTVALSVAREVQRQAGMAWSQSSDQTVNCPPSIDR